MQCRPNPKTLNLMKGYLIFSLALAMALPLGAQNGTPPTAGARSLGMGGTGVSFTDINSIFSNQAGLSSLEGFTATAFSENRFLVSEIRTFSLGAALPTASGTFGLSLHYFGFDAYNEQRIGLAYARPLFDKLSLGAQFLLLNTRIPEYGNKALPTFELGLLAEVLPEVNFGIHLSSPARIEVVDEENLPTVLRLGFSYLPSDKLQLLAEVEKDIDYPARARFGVEYRAVEALFLRFGIATEPTSMSFGLGLQLENSLRLNVASSYHQVLGFTPGASITYGIFKNE